MATFVLLPGAGGEAWYWHRVLPILERAGHDVTAVDFPGHDEHAGLDAYADLAVAAVGDRRDVILVAQSLAGFTAPLVAARVPLRMIVLVNAMIPEPGETPGAWWGNTGFEEARIAAALRGGYTATFDLTTYFLHDVPEEVVREGESHQRPEKPIVFSNACRFDAWPKVPTRVLVGSHDRFFPAEFQRRIARERLGVEVEEVDGGHLVALSNPEGVAERLLALV